jgi:hypothetical protein
MTHTSPPTESPAAFPALGPFPPIRHNGWNPQKQRGFCEMLAETGLVDRAAKAVGMSRESAYRLRRRADGRAFALGWDAALLLARQRLIDETFELAFEGSLEQHFVDGELKIEKRRRDPKSLLATVERLGAQSALGSEPVKAVAQDFETFLDCLEYDAEHHGDNSLRFLTASAARAESSAKPQLAAARSELSRAMKQADQSEAAWAGVVPVGDVPQGNVPLLPAD